jgi:hypothetical protein
MPATRDRRAAALSLGTQRSNGLARPRMHSGSIPLFRLHWNAPHMHARIFFMKGGFGHAEHAE